MKIRASVRKICEKSERERCFGGDDTYRDRVQRISALFKFKTT